MKSMLLILVSFFLLLQFHLWFAEGGILTAVKREQVIVVEDQRLDKLQWKNSQLLAEIKDLKENDHAIEEHARNDLGMIKKDEQFYQIVPM